MIFLLIIRKKSYIKCNAFYFRSLLLKININTMKTINRIWVKRNIECTSRFRRKINCGNFSIKHESSIVDRYF